LGIPPEVVRSQSSCPHWPLAAQDQASSSFRPAQIEGASGQTPPSGQQTTEGPIEQQLGGDHQREGDDVGSIAAAIRLVFASDAADDSAEQRALVRSNVGNWLLCRRITRDSLEAAFSSENCCPPNSQANQLRLQLLNLLDQQEQQQQGASLQQGQQSDANCLVAKHESANSDHVEQMKQQNANTRADSLLAQTAVPKEQNMALESASCIVEDQQQSSTDRLLTKELPPSTRSSSSSAKRKRQSSSSSSTASESPSMSPSSCRFARSCGPFVARPEEKRSYTASETNQSRTLAKSSAPPQTADATRSPNSTACPLTSASTVPECSSVHKISAKQHEEPHKCPPKHGGLDIEESGSRQSLGQVSTSGQQTASQQLQRQAAAELGKAAEKCAGPSSVAPMGSIPLNELQGRAQGTSGGGSGSLGAIGSHSNLISASTSSGGNPLAPVANLEHTDKRVAISKYDEDDIDDDGDDDSMYPEVGEQRRTCYRKRLHRSHNHCELHQQQQQRRHQLHHQQARYLRNHTCRHHRNQQLQLQLQQQQQQQLQLQLHDCQHEHQVQALRQGREQAPLAHRVSSLERSRETQTRCRPRGRRERRGNLRRTVGRMGGSDSAALNGGESSSSEQEQEREPTLTAGSSAGGGRLLVGARPNLERGPNGGSGSGSGGGSGERREQDRRQLALNGRPVEAGRRVGRAGLAARRGGGGCSRQSLATSHRPNRSSTREEKKRRLNECEKYRNHISGYIRNLPLPRVLLCYLNYGREF